LSSVFHSCFFLTVQKKECAIPEITTPLQWQNAPEAVHATLVKIAGTVNTVQKKVVRAGCALNKKIVVTRRKPCANIFYACCLLVYCCNAAPQFKMLPW
jgi:hypothetical protein